MGQTLLACTPAIEAPCQPGPTPPSMHDATLLKRIITRYQLIEIMQHPQYGNMLVIDNDLQIAESDHIYGQAMVAPLKALSTIQRVLIMGGGDGGVLQELLKTADSFGWPLLQVNMVDIDEDVIHACRQYLSKLNAGAFNDRRAKVQTEDVFAHIKKCRDLDAVIYDLTMAPVVKGQSRAAFIEETLADIACALKPGGILSMQCCGEGETGPIIGEDNAALLNEIRHYVDRFFTRRSEQQVSVPSYHEKWTFLSAQKRSSPL